MNLTNKKGVDISSNNGDISMETIKNAGYDFVMIRCGFGEDIESQDDNRWEQNVRKAEAAGLPWGAYFYSYACSEESARSELRHALRLLKGKRPTMPVAFDMEDADGYKADHGGWNYHNVDRACRIFLGGIKDAGYYPMLYTGFEEIENYISQEVVDSYDIWFAHWARSCGYKGKNLCMWQYGGETNLIESNSIPGVGVIDKDLCYRDYPTIIKNGGWNNWGTPEPLPDYPDDDFPPYQNGTVKDVQKWLNSAYDARLEVDGICGPLTKKALISALQTILNDTYGAGLDVDGIFGRKTKAAIRNLSNGDTGDYVRVLQGFLICHGYDVGGLDGIFGYMTKSSVLTFQTVHNLTVDGIAGRNTFDQLANS